MAMNMLQAGGMPVLADGVRTADSSNPAGYFEYEPVKGLEDQRDVAWLPAARGKAVKVISWLLTWLPETYDYQVVFMQRDLDEVIRSQNAMLAARGEQDRIGDSAAMRDTYERHLDQVRRFLARRSCFSELIVEHRRVIEEPASEASRLAAFVGRPLDVERMAAAVDPRLYRATGGQIRP